MKVTVLFSTISGIIIWLLVWTSSLIFNFSFEDWAFFIGIGLSALLLFFNSSGGLHTRMTNFGTDIQHGRQQEVVWKLDVGVIFYGSLLFTAVSLVIMVISYRSYF
ncbi:hypothetical protein Q7A53_11065 [Halobacillus rhizosphaerae]|uniref:hypothetical protein n=1 Tax=Halobacillus rhizosphaerae TaxID=3064889 RepID=UPI00398AD34D